MSKVSPISECLLDAANTLKATLDKETVIILSVDHEGRLQIGWTGNKTVNLMGALGWGLTALAQYQDNEEI